VEGNNHSLIEVPSLQLTFSKNLTENQQKFKSGTYWTEIQAVPAHMNLCGSKAYHCWEPHHHDQSIMSEYNCLFKLRSEFRAIKTHLYGYRWNGKLLSTQISWLSYNMWFFVFKMFSQLSSCMAIHGSQFLFVYFILQGSGMTSNFDTLQFHHKAFNNEQSPVTADTMLHLSFQAHFQILTSQVSLPCLCNL
jgi:hypothetical protein